MGILQDIKTALTPRLCPVCRSRLWSTERHICSTCLTALPHLNVVRTDDNEMVRLLWPHVPAVNALAVFKYKGSSSLHNIVVKIKSKGGQDMAVEMGRLSAREMQKTGLHSKVDVLVPVPVSRKNKRTRGFNQALMIARGISEITGLPVCDCLSCLSTLKQQKTLNKEERMENARHNFVSALPDEYRGKRILLIDDIFTTGATLTGCALAVLRDDPTAEISVMTLAKA